MNAHLHSSRGAPGDIRLPLPRPNHDGWFLGAQALAALIVVCYIAAEIAGVPWPLNVQEYAPVALFGVPMLYVSRGFRPGGAVAIAAMVLVLVTLDVVLERGGWQRWADGLQVALVGTVALVVGYRVHHEIGIRRRVEHAGDALRLSEARYRALFEQSQAPILVVRGDGIVQEANAAAAALFGDRQRGVHGQLLAALLPEVAHGLAIGACPPIVGHRREGLPEVVLRPRCTLVGTADGVELRQIVLQDVTEEQHQRRRMDAYAAYILQGQEEERRRIAQELHDEPIQSLVSLCRHLDRMAESGRVSGVTLAALAETRTLAEDIARGLRELARGLRPPTLEDLGLRVALEHLCATFEDGSGITTTLRVRGEERRLRPEIELGLFRIVQEALRNVERHAAAGHVAVSVVYGPAMRLSVRDDGIGFPVPGDAREQEGAGLGLLGMQERAVVLGGRLTVRSAIGAGTTIRVTIPCAPPPARVAVSLLSGQQQEA